MNTENAFPNCFLKCVQVFHPKYLTHPHLCLLKAQNDYKVMIYPVCGGFTENTRTGNDG